MADTTSTPDLKNPPSGGQMTAVLVVATQPKLNEARNGKSYYRCRLANGTGQIDAYIWEDQVEVWNDINELDAVEVTGRVDDFGIKISDTRRIEGDHPVFDELNPRYPDFEELETRFEAVKAEIQDPGYQRFVERFFETACPWADYSTAPAALRNHHAYVHGLLHHSLEVAENAIAAIDAQGLDEEVVNRDLVITGALIHDSGKIHEYAWKGRPMDMARDAVLYGHVTTGPLHVAKTMAEHAEELKELGFTQADAKHLIHIQVSHHREREWGSPVPPATVAAELIHRSDYISAGVRKIADFVRTATPDRHGFIAGDRKAGFWAGAMRDPSTAGRQQAAPEEMVEEEEVNTETQAADAEEPMEADTLFDGPISDQLGARARAAKEKEQAAPTRARSW